NYHRSDVYGLNLNMQYASDLGITSFGGEFRNEGILSSNLGRLMRQKSGNYDKWDNRSNISFFVEHNFVFDKLTLSVGGLYNYNTALADTLKANGFYPAINVSYRTNDAVSLYASWSKSTRMPTFTDLYYKAGKHRGFAGLTPEYSQSVEIGWRYKNSVLTANLNVFYTKGDNLIDWILNPLDGFYHAQNLASLGTYGAGWDATVNMHQWLGEQQPLQSIQIGYQYMSQKSDEARQNNPVSAYVFNYLRHKFTVGVQHRIVKNLSLSWNLRWQDRAGNYLKYITEIKEEQPTAYQPFGLVDVKANYALHNINIFVNANNIFNTTHVDFGNIPQPGFWLTGGMSYTLR
ncbi:MAG TPA: TonB-dependent receptor, partial [Porphyromonadaceae bacterium]|nr:TonB-dependent receptor [Porphyromonadaceae bacterium]